MLIRSKKRWELPESAATAESVYLNRRNLMKGALALGAAGTALGATTRESQALFGLFEGEGGSEVPLTVEGDPTADLYPAFTNPKFCQRRATADR
jgi:sulfoxide reductase catalytic subunit YedY